MSFMIVTAKPEYIDAPGAHLLDLFGTAAYLSDTEPSGFKYLVNSDTFEPVAHVLSFLSNSLRLATRSLATESNKCDALYEWFLYLEAINFDYRDAKDAHIEDYRERLLATVSPKTRQPLADGTVAGRIQIIRGFYDFLDKNRFRDAVGIPPILNCRGRPVDLPTVRTRTSAPRRPTLRLVKYVPESDLRLILTALGDPPDQGSRPTRDWLIALISATTGMRIFEVLALTVYQILDLERKLSHETTKILLTVTKGSVPRLVDIPTEVVKYILAYIGGERAKAITAGLKSKSLKKDHGRVFVNSTACQTKFVGRPYREKQFEAFFAETLMAIDMTEVTSVYDLDTRRVVRTKKVPRHTIHHLRHTYAIRAWVAYRHLPQEDRWIRIQLQLGHASYKTTANTYLRAVAALEAAPRDLYVESLKLMIGSVP